ncbi:hypothetical protein BPO_p0126 (plasmid) [Bergeyella porcorum]|uniref:Uncharacterized protein n=1 Tax=Bergeyella porcorum TaxID=1735111 RepID=A0AAU0F4P9_9FLAO
MYNSKSLDKHSLGQRASALILFLLAQKDNDILIIDHQRMIWIIRQFMMK